MVDITDWSETASTHPDLPQCQVNVNIATYGDVSPTLMNIGGIYFKDL
jgi:hypothetical protein